MSIEFNGRTVLVISLVVLGLGFEALKAASGNHFLTTDDGQLESHPYAISERTLHSMKQAIVSHLPSHESMTKLIPFDLTGAIEKWKKQQAKALADEKKKKDAAKGWHWAWDAKKQKWVWKKKAKKKADTEVASDANNDQQMAAPAPTNPQQNASSNTAATATAGSLQPNNNSASSSLAGGGGGTADHFLSLEEWESLLLQTPNTAETKYFVQQYQDHMVTDTMFYQIVNMMLKSSNTAMQQQGLLALSLTPSAQSFADLAAEQQSLQSGSANYQAAAQDLNQYSQSQYVSILQQVLAQSQTATVLIAAENVLQQAIQSDKGTSSGQPVAQGGAQSFTSFEPILNTLKTNSNSTVASLAETLLGMLGDTVAREARLR